MHPNAPARARGADVPAGPTVWGSFDWNAATGALELSHDCRLRLLGDIAARSSVALRCVLRAVHPEDRRSVLQLATPQPGSEPHQAIAREFRVATCGGGHAWVRLCAQLDRDERGRIARAHGQICDMSALRESNERLRRSEERLRLLWDALPGAMHYELDLRTGRADRNDVVVRLLGVKPGADEPTIRWWEDRVHPDDIGAVVAAFARAFTSREDRVEVRYRMRHERGTWVWLRDRARVVRDDNGVPVRVVGVAEDLTGEHDAQSRAAQATRELEQALATLRGLVAAAPVGIALFDADQRYRLVNDRLAEMNGRPASDHAGRSIADMVPDLAGQIAPLFEAALRGEHSGPHVIEGETASAPGRRRSWVEWWFPSTVGDGPGAGVVVQEITEQRQAEAALRRSESRFRALTETIPQVVWHASAEGRCLFVSPQWERMTGTTAAAALGEGWQHAIHPDDLPLVAERWREALHDGSPFDVECRLRAPGGGHRWVLSRGSRIPAGPEGPAAWIGTITDIHARKDAEAALLQDKDTLERLVRERTADLERSHRQLRFAERMSFVGSLSAGLGHDMANLLAPMRMRLDALAQSVADPAARQDIDALRASVEYLARLTASLRLMSIDPARASASETTDLRAWWAEAEPLMRMVLPGGVTLEADLAPDCGRVRAGRAVITQVVFNLVQNAGEAHRRRGYGHVWLHAAADDGFVTLTVRDDGPGMPPEVRERCLDAGFSTKPTPSGLGLSLVLTLLAQCGGSAAVDSEPQRGTTFTVRLRSAADHPTPPRALPAYVEIADPRLRSFVAAELRSLRCDVIEDPAARASALVRVVEARKAPADAHAGPGAVVVLGAAGRDHAPGRLSLNAGASPAEIRAALRQAVAALG